MSRIHSKDTTPEKLLRSLLFRNGYRFRKNVNSLPGKPDIVLKKFNMVIFVHGCFWHRHTGCTNSVMPKTRTEFWEAKLNSNIERDRKNIIALEAEGWRVLVVWECELKNQPDSVLANVISQLEIVADGKKN